MRKKLHSLFTCFWAYRKFSSNKHLIQEKNRNILLGGYQLTPPETTVAVIVLDIIVDVFVVSDVVFVGFLSSANEVSTGPTCQFLSVCLCVCVCVFPVFFSRRLIGSYTGF